MLDKKVMRITPIDSFSPSSSASSPTASTSTLSHRSQALQMLTPPIGHNDCGEALQRKLPVPKVQQSDDETRRRPSTTYTARHRTHELAPTVSPFNYPPPTPLYLVGNKLFDYIDIPSEPASYRSQSENPPTGRLLTPWSSPTFVASRATEAMLDFKSAESG